MKENSRQAQGEPTELPFSRVCLSPRVRLAFASHSPCVRFRSLAKLAKRKLMPVLQAKAPEETKTEARTEFVQKSPVLIASDKQ